MALGNLAGVAQAVRQRRADLLDREPGQALVEDLRHPVERLLGDGAAHLHEHRPHRPAPQGEHHQDPLARDLHQFQPLEHDVLEGRRHGHAQFLGQHAEHLRGAAEQLVHRVSGAREFVLQGLPCLVAGWREVHQAVHVDPVGQVGGDAAGRGVRMVEQPLVLELAHDVAHRGRRHAQPEAMRDGPAAGGLRRLDVGLDDRLEDVELAGGEVLGGCHGGESNQAASATNASSRSHPSAESRSRPSATAAHPAATQRSRTGSGTRSRGTPAEVRSPR